LNVRVPVNPSGGMSVAPSPPEFGAADPTDGRVI
jgi:hypothetical protein